MEKPDQRRRNVCCNVFLLIFFTQRCVALLPLLIYSRLSRKKSCKKVAGKKIVNMKCLFMVLHSQLPTLKSFEREERVHIETWLRLKCILTARQANFYYNFCKLLSLIMSCRGMSGGGGVGFY